MYWRFTPAWPRPSSPGRSRRSPHRQPAPPPAPPRRLLQAGRREPADLAHRCQRVPRRPVQQPLHPVRRPVPGMLGDRPPVPLRQLADQRGHVPARMLPRPRPGKAPPQGAHQLSPFTDRPPSPYPGSSSRLRFICPHKHMIVRRLRPRHTNPCVPPGQTANGGCRTRASGATKGQPGNTAAARSAGTGSPTPATCPAPPRSGRTGGTESPSGPSSAHPAHPASSLAPARPPHR